MNLYKYILSILFPVVLSVLTFSCKEEAGIELFQNLDIVGEVPVQEGSLRCTVLHGGTINVYGGVGKYDVFSSDEGRNGRKPLHAFLCSQKRTGYTYSHG